MKKICAYLLLLAITIAVGFPLNAFCQSKQINAWDGTEWLESERSNQGQNANLGLIMGLILGTWVYRNKTGEEIEFIEAILPDDSKGATSTLSTLGQDLSLMGISTGQLHEGVNTLYSDFSNRRIRIIDAIYVIKMQIEGKSADVVQAQLRYLKMQPISDQAKSSAFSNYIEIAKENISKKKTGLTVTTDDISSGRISEDEILLAGYYIDRSNQEHRLFCYGDYR